MKCEYCETNVATIKDYRDLYNGAVSSKYFCCDTCFNKSDKAIKSMMTRRFKKSLDKSSSHI